MLPTTLRTGDLWFYVCGADVDGAAIPSVMVRRGGAEATVAIPTANVMEAAGFAPRELRRIRALVRDHRRLLLQAWEDYARRCEW